MIYNFVLRGKEIRIDDVVLCYVFWDSYYRSHFLRQLQIQQKRLYSEIFNLYFTIMQIYFNLNIDYIKKFGYNFVII